MILSGQTIEQVVQSGQMSIDPFQKENLRGASYTFTLGSKLRIPKKMPLVSLETGITFDEIKIEDKGFILEPNQFVLGFTQEILSLKNTFTCTLSARGSCAQIGLNVLLSSTFAEPDTNSVMIIEIYNASQNPILLKPGMPIVKGIFTRIE